MEDVEGLRKKIRRCDKLGAKRFRPLVKKAEELKFKLLKDIFPALPEKYENHLKRKRDKELRKAKDEAERRKIIENYHKLLIEWKKEIQREKNRNYHMDENSPTEIINYVEWNKKVHIKGLITDAAVITGAAILIGAKPTLAEVFMQQAPSIYDFITTYLTPVAFVTVALELISAFINFQCINLQNSHIYRFQIVQDRLQKEEQRKRQQLLGKYGALACVYERCLSNSPELPSIQDLIKNCQTLEELQQLELMIRAEQAGHANKGRQRCQQPSKEQIVPPICSPENNGGDTKNKELAAMLQGNGKQETSTGFQKTMGGIKYE